jgi:hypothetical protein
MLLNNGKGKYLYFVNLADMSDEQSLLVTHIEPNSSDLTLDAY